MANPTSIDNKPALLAASTTTAEIAINGNRSYTLIHESLTEAGAADTNTVFFSAGAAAVDADQSSAAEKFTLPDGASRTIGPGVNSLKFATAAGAPTFVVLPGRSTPREA